MDRWVISNSMRRFFKAFSMLFMIVAPSRLQAQTETPTAQTMLDPAPWVSPRASGMGGALSTTAENIDAMYYNPAGIGGQTYGGKPDKEPFVRQVVFPRAGLSLNSNASSLNSEFTSSGAKTNAETGAMQIKDHEGERQYARASLSPVGLFLGRIGVVPVIDQQIAAIPQNNDNSQIEFRYRSFSGALIGSSVTDSKGVVSVGMSTQVGTISETYGTIPYTDMVDVTKRNEFMKENEKVYQAKGVNAGLIIRAPNKWSPSLAVVARDVGSTQNAAQKGATDPLVTQEDLTTGFGVSPKIGKWAHLNLTMESGYLTAVHMSASKKLRMGAELLIGHSKDSKALLGVRAGATSAGASFGGHINLGLIGLEVSSYAVDIGVDNERVVERRNAASAYVDVASF